MMTRFRMRLETGPISEKLCSFHNRSITRWTESSNGSYKNHLLKPLDLIRTAMHYTSNKTKMKSPFKLLCFPFLKYTRRSARVWRCSAGYRGEICQIVAPHFVLVSWVFVSCLQFRRQWRVVHGGNHLKSILWNLKVWLCFKVEVTKIAALNYWCWCSSGLWHGLDS
jgi:hypothetical protein